jgi:G3E family GTPase
MDKAPFVTDAIPTVLVTGFLGAGKTTTINRLIRHVVAAWGDEPRTLAVMINEFASIGIDGALVPDEIASLGDGYHKIELNRGSIFCACIRTDFIAELKKLAAAVKPDLLLIEATGVARVDDLYLMMRQDGLDRLLRIVRNICVADAVNFHKVERTLEAVSVQARFADAFILNKIDRADPALVDATEALLAGHNPGAPVYRAVHADVPFGEILDQGSGTDGASTAARGTAPTASVPEFRSASMQFRGVFDPAKWQTLISSFEPEQLLRAKGVIVYADGARYFEVINGEYSERCALASLAAKGVSIFSFITKDEIADTLSSRVRTCRTND